MSITRVNGGECLQPCPDGCPSDDACTSDVLVEHLESIRGPSDGDQSEHVLAEEMRVHRLAASPPRGEADRIRPAVLRLSEQGLTEGDLGVVPALRQKGIRQSPEVV